MGTKRKKFRRFITVLFRELKKKIRKKYHPRMEERIVTTTPKRPGEIKKIGFHRLKSEEL